MIKFEFAVTFSKKANNFAKTLEKMLRLCYISIARLILNCTVNFKRCINKNFHNREKIKCKLY